MDKYCKEDVQEIAKEYEQELPVEIIKALASEYGCQLLCDGEERELLSGLYTKKYELLFDDVWTDVQCRFFERYFKKDVLEDEYELFTFIRYFDLVKEEPYNTLDGYSLFMNRIVLADQLLNKYGINLSMDLYAPERGWEIDMLADVLLLRKEETEELLQRQQERYRDLEWSSGRTTIRHARSLTELVKALELHKANCGYNKRKDLEEICLGRKQLMLVNKDEELYATLLVVKGTVEEIRKKKRGQKVDETILKYIQEKCLALSGRYFYSLNEKIPPVYES